MAQQMGASQTQRCATWRCTPSPWTHTASSCRPQGRLLCAPEQAPSRPAFTRLPALPLQACPKVSDSLKYHFFCKSATQHSRVLAVWYLHVFVLQRGSVAGLCKHCEQCKTSNKVV